MNFPFEMCIKNTRPLGLASSILISVANKFLFTHEGLSSIFFWSQVITTISIFDFILIKKVTHNLPVLSILKIRMKTEK